MLDIALNLIIYSKEKSFHLVEALIYYLPSSFTRPRLELIATFESAYMYNYKFIVKDTQTC